MGFPDKKILALCKYKKKYFNDRNIFFKGFSNNGKTNLPKTKSINKFLSNHDSDLVDLIKVSVFIIYNLLFIIYYILFNVILFIIIYLEMYCLWPAW